MDQTPLAFEFLNGRTYDKRGSNTIWLKESRSGSNKRQATLQLCVFVDGEPQCKPLLMFKGKEKGDSRRRTEEKKYHPSVTVIFNEKAYANSTNLKSWIKT
jgi:hypothetical protein